MNSTEWKLPHFYAQAPESLIQAGYSSLLSAVLLSRGIDTAAAAKTYLSRSEDMLCDPFLLNDMDKAVKRIKQAIDTGEKTAVYGDYDVDGITASCLLSGFLRENGLDCEIYIPDRIDEGYGLNSEAVTILQQKGVTLVITVDCGITAISEAAKAKSLGMDIIITDHHECPRELPEAVAVIDPKRHDSNYPNDILAGVGVAFKLICAISADTPAMLDRYSDLVAVGTVADVMPIESENRVLVYKGLRKLISSPRPGFAALLEESGVSGRPINSSTVGFSIAPRINAAGRLCHTETSVSLLLTDDDATAHSCAAELCNLNRRRQELETRVWEESLAFLGTEPPFAPIVLADENWHPGVVGIAASRLSEEYKLPAIIIHLDEDIGKGSCRSYGDFNLFDALSACSDHLVGFGGHAFAAGLTIKRENIDSFRDSLADYYRQNTPENQLLLEPELLLRDLQLMRESDVASLEALEPCGGGNPRPMMCVCGVLLESLSLIGGGKHLRMRVAKNGIKVDCVYFSHSVVSDGVSEGSVVDICFTPQINEFRSQKSVQLLISDIRPSRIAEECRGILDGSFVPERDEFIERNQLAIVWRTIAKAGKDIDFTITEVISGNAYGTDPVGLFLCLKIFEELGLIALEVYDDRVSVSIISTGSKADLENSPIFRRFSQK